MAYYSVARRYGDASQHPSEYWTVTYHLILFASESASGFPVVWFQFQGLSSERISERASEMLY